jgi:hypothetical protein
LANNVSIVREHPGSDRKKIAFISEIGDNTLFGMNQLFGLGIQDYFRQNISRFYKKKKARKPIKTSEIMILDATKQSELLEKSVRLLQRNFRA